MAYEVWWSSTAERDRDHIVDYLFHDLGSPRAAARFLDELDGAIGLLEDNPLLFAVSNEPRLRRLGYRKALVMNYVALYRVEGERVLVAHIFHQRQDYARLI